MSSPEDEFNEFEDFDDDKRWNYFPPKKVQHPEQNPSPLRSDQEDNAAPQNQTPKFEQLPWKRSREGDAVSQNVKPESTRVPWKRSKGYKPFVGDAAIVELRNKALAPDRLSEPAAPSPGRRRRTALWLTGIPMMMAIGIAGYELGPAPLPQHSPHSNQFDQSGLLPKQAQQQDQSTYAASVGSGAPTPPIKSEPRRLDTSTIAANMKIGVELMTYGEVVKARMMFQPVAEAGQGNGAFALAETYDPLVLGELRLREGTMPDLAQARTWYERARDLGSPDARDRISRLAQLPH
jgi:hypothetical protein